MLLTDLVLRGSFTKFGKAQRKPVGPRWSYLVIAAQALVGLSADAAWGATYTADPTATSGPNYYMNIVGQLKPGDTLQLPAGTYSNRLSLRGLHGAAGAWITITGPATGAPAIITTTSNCCNTVQLDDTYYVVLKNVTIDANSDGVGESIDGINAGGGATHDIVIENCVIRGVSFHQQTVGIATRSAAWNWTIRGNTIQEAGTGAYLGNSDGAAPFVGGLIENNLFVDTIGYNLEIKYQNPYTAPAGMPTGARRTIIRDNVFLKRRSQSSWPAGKLSGIRPNLLVGGFPDSGPGVDDIYEIYGNFFYQNVDGESLVQASGRVTIHDNVFVGATGAAIYLANHDRPLKYADIYNNTIFGAQRGVWLASTAAQQSTVVGNLVFANVPVSGVINTQADNITGTTADAAKFVRSPSTQLGTMDFYPLPGQAQGTALDLSRFSTQTDFHRDFNGTDKGTRRYRGAYAGEGTNPGWQLDAAKKTGSVIRPNPPADVRAD